MHLHLSKNTKELSIALADWMVKFIAATLEKNGRFTIALSGGSTPQQLYGLLAQLPYREQIEWPAVHVFWGDERAVPADDDRNNAKMAHDTLLSHVPIPPHQVHRMRTDIKPEAAAAEYNKILHRYFDTSPNSFDLVLLGMGDDGHTLSLFPNKKEIHEENAWATAFFLQAQDMYRITLTAPIVNKSAAIVFLVAGSSKSNTLQQVLEGDYLPDTYPSQVIRPMNGELHWFVDEAAASGLKGSSGAGE